MLVTTTGRFPIVSDGRHPLRAAVEEWRGRVTPTPESAWQDSALRSVQAQTQAELLAAQDDAGADILDPGYVPIHDEWFQMARVVPDLEVAAPLRYWTRTPTTTTGNWIGCQHAGQRALSSAPIGTPPH